MTTYFDTIRAERMTIGRALTALVWGRRGPGVQFLAANSSAKMVTLGTPAAVAAGTGYLIGTNSAAWEYKINAGTLLRVGMATILRAMSAVGAGVDVVFRELVVAEGDTISFALSATTLTITAGAAAVVVPMTGFAGQILYPWAANTPVGEDYSLTIRQIRGATMRVTTAGGFEINTASATDAAPMAIITGGAGLTVDGAAVGGVAPAPVTTVGPAVAAFTGTVTPLVNITLTFSRVGNTVTMSWNNVFFIGVGAPSAILSLAAIPAGMAPSETRHLPMIALNNNVFAAGVVLVYANRDIAFGIAAPGFGYTGGPCGTIPASVTWIAGA